MHEWNADVEIFSCPQVIENFSKYLFLRTAISQKNVVGAPVFHLRL